MINVPPDAWLNEPEPVVERFPVSVIVPFEKPTCDASTTISLKFDEPVPLITEPAPLNLTMLVLPMKVPVVIQLPPTICKKLPPLNVVEEPIETFPPTVIGAA